MSTSRKLSYQFSDQNGSLVTYSFNYIKANPTSTDVLNIATSMVTNKAIWERQPTLLKSIKLIETDTTEYDISSLSFSIPEEARSTLANPDIDEEKVVKEEVISTNKEEIARLEKRLAQLKGA